MSDELKEGTTGRPDRVFVSIGGATNYSQFKIDAGVSSDVCPGETVEEAQERVEEAVMSYLEKQTGKLKRKVKELITSV